MEPKAKPDLHALMAAGTWTVTVDEAALLLGIGRNSAYRSVKAGEIPSVKLGGRVLIPIPKLLAFLGMEND